MGKRNSIVVVSSDGEDEGFDLSSSSVGRYTKLKLKSRLNTPRSNSRSSRTKRARYSADRSHSRSSKDSGKVHEISLFHEDFNEVFTGTKVSAGIGRSNSEELWVDKYKPCSMEELAVHRKKVEEVRTWFEERLNSPADALGHHVLLITGQAGIGKSATIHVVASNLGARLCEWKTPTPLIWQEHLHNSGAGVSRSHYTSKLDEFENFVERIRKYGVIQFSSNEETKSSIILVIDDLPVTNGRVAFERLKNCLILLVRSTQIPTVVLVTDYGNIDSADYNTRCLEEIRLCLENAGACKIAFNPITNNSLKKALSRICQLEQCRVTAEHIDLIAKASGGDIRQAITSLQFFCVKPDQVHSLLASKEKEHGPKTVDDGFSLHFSKDETLSLFHALGKFLHNKRETNCAIENGAFVIQDRFARLPLKMEAPEVILCQSHGQPRPVVDFLHENVLDFLSEESIRDAWTIASYLGDSDLLLSTHRGMLARSNDLDSIFESAAASVAVRGVLYGNSCPQSSRWHAIRRPSLWQVERTSSSSKTEMKRLRDAAINRLSLSNVSTVASEYIPALKWLGNGIFGHHEAHQVQGQYLDLENINVGKMSLDDQESNMSDDDDIEGW